MPRNREEEGLSDAQHPGVRVGDFVTQTDTHLSHATSYSLQTRQREKGTTKDCTTARGFSCWVFGSKWKSLACRNAFFHRTTNVAGKTRSHIAAGLSIFERMQGLTLAMGTYEKALKEAETHVHFPRKVTLSPFHSLKGGPTVIGGPLTLVVFCSEALWKMTIHLCGRCSMRRSPNSQSCKPSINRAYPHS